jgi:integrase
LPAWSLSTSKTDHSGRVRLIFIPPGLAEQLQVARGRYESGPLLRSRKGMPWKPRGIVEALRRLRRKTGVRAIAYGYRHTFATDALVNGVPDAQVAALLGHSGTTVLHRHYSHLGARAQAMRDALARVRG